MYNKDEVRTILRLVCAGLMFTFLVCNTMFASVYFWSKVLP